MNAMAFVTQTDAKDVDGMVIPKETYSPSCSGWTKALINGHESLPLSKEAINVQTNSGMLFPPAKASPAMYIRLEIR